MENKQLFNVLPRPTFRWLKCNHLESELKTVSIDESALTLSGDIEIVSTLLDNELMNDDFKGASVEALKIVAEQFTSGYEINTIANSKHHLDVHINLNDENRGEILRLRINAEAHSELSLNIILESEAEVDGIVNILTEINAEENAVVNIKKVQLLGDKIQQIEHRYANLQTEAVVNYLNVELGGQENIYNYQTDMQESKSELNQEFAYLGDKEQRYDISMLMQHQGKKSKCNVNVLGALTGDSKKAFRGTLDFLRGCAGSEGAEEDTCLLLNERVKSISLPLLLCKEDNVVGNHAASAGQIDKNKLFYLMSRGFSEQEAKVMLVESMIRPIIDMIGHEDIEKKSLEFIKAKIN